MSSQFDQKDSHRPPRMGRAMLTLMLCVTLYSSALQAAPPENTVELVDLEGQTHTPLRNAKAKATILFFLLPDCPISNAYAPEIKRIAAQYAEQEIASFIVYVSPDLSVEDAKKHATDYGYEIPVLRDLSFELVRETEVTIAPEVAVVSAEGKCLYRGRIDNLYAALGKRRFKATQHDLRNALDAILQGVPVPQETTKAIGCYIPKPKTDARLLTR
ncbi:redoxin family protein [Schlesneria sp. DSM 10557]|uniref:redoxin family protein n=1 Tax=Schlesneria sp. DSM 10557 TaxID=3044399 RepID=UPI0035A125D8